MRSIRRSRIALVFAVVCAGLTVTGMAVAVGGSNSVDQGIVEINTHDFKSEHKVGFNVDHFLGDTVDNQNTAYAQSSGCTHCNATAIAIQVVLVQTNNVSTVTPTNLAFAVNQNCSYCKSTGLAYQYAISTNGLVHFSAEGSMQLAQLRQQIDDEAASITDDPAALKAAVDPLVHQMWAVVDNELVHSGTKYDATPYEDAQFDRTGSTGSESPSPSATASPSEAATASPTPSDSPLSTASSPCPDVTGVCASDSPTPAGAETPASTPAPADSSSGSQPTEPPSDSPSPTESPSPSSSSSP